MIIDGYETNAEHREELLNIYSRINILTAKTRKVFYYNAVNLAGLDRFKHLLKIRTLKVRAGIAVIAVFFYHCYFRVFLEKVHDQQSLIGDTVTLKFFAGK